MLICDNCLPDDIRRGPVVGYGECRICGERNMVFNAYPGKAQLQRIRDGKTIAELAEDIEVYYRDIENLEEKEVTPRDIVSWLKLVSYYGDLLGDTEPSIPAMRGPHNPEKIIYDRFCEEAFYFDIKTAAIRTLQAFPYEVKEHSLAQMEKNRKLQKAGKR